MKKLLILVFLYHCPFFNYSQSSISGTLKNEKGTLISGASITISEFNEENTLNYAISDNNGNFSILINNNSKKLRLKIRSMGYKIIIEEIDNKTQIKDFILIEEVIELKEIILKSSSITQKGDTINYSVNAFTKKEDRTIADVLKNMPGIEILSDGKILYQGRSINKYYIEGLDLLEGKYNLANSNLPYKEVSKVQVLENHQPIKVLDSLVYSNQAAINIKLKNSYSFTGQAEVGIGFSPLLWSLNITPMLFSKKKQMLNSYQANNLGNDVALQLKTLTIEDLLEQFERNDEKQDWLAIQQLETPNFSNERWLDNNIHLITTNYLQKLKNDYKLRLNVAYINDYQEQNGYTNTRFFTANDTIVLFENKYNQLYTNTLETNLTLQKNTDKNFLKNSLQFQGFWDSQQGNIEQNSRSINQYLSNRYFKVSNNFKSLFPWGKQIISFNSYISLNKTPQSLEASPGQFNEVLNDGNPYNEVKQHLELQAFYTNNSMSFTRGWRQFSFSPKFGIQFERQHLESKISTSTNNSENNSFVNSLAWTRSKAYVNLKTQFKKNKWSMELTTPVNVHNYKLEDTPLQKEQDLKRITFEPNLSINYDLTSFWRISTSGNLSNQFGTINQLHYNYILKNYRTIQRINAPLPQTENVGYSTSIKYKNPIKSLFFNVIYSNTTNTKNLLYNNQIIESGATELKAIVKDNKRNSHTFITRASKYFREVNTNLTSSVNYSLQDFQQILNNQIIDLSNQNWRINSKIDTDITDWLNTELESIFQFSNNKIQGQNNQTITQQFHKFNVNIYPEENQYLALKTEYVKNNLFSENTKNIFTNLIYRYTWEKKNIDFELEYNNIFNTNNYRTVNIDNFSYVETNFSLRPSQLMFSVKFSL